MIDRLSDVTFLSYPVSCMVNII